MRDIFRRGIMAGTLASLMIFPFMDKMQYMDGQADYSAQVSTDENAVDTNTKHKDTYRPYAECQRSYETGSPGR